MGERRSFDSAEELLRHAGLVRSLAIALLGAGPEADEVVQETWLAALSARGPRPRRPRAWLAGVVRHLAFRRIRGESRRRRRETRAAEAFAGRPPAPAADEAAMRLEAERRLLEAVEGLPDPVRTTVILRFLDGLSVADTAARTGTTPGAVKSRTHRGLALLRERLGGRAALPLVLAVGAGPAVERRSGGSSGRPPVAAASAIALLGGTIMTLKTAILGSAAAAAVAAAILLSRPDEAARPAPPDVDPSLPSATRIVTAAPAGTHLAAPEKASDVASPVAAPLPTEPERIRGVLFVDGAPAAGRLLRLEDADFREWTAATGPGGDFRFDNLGRSSSA